MIHSLLLAAQLVIPSVPNNDISPEKFIPETLKTYSCVRDAELGDIVKGPEGADYQTVIVAVKKGHKADACEKEILADIAELSDVPSTFAVSSLFVVGWKLPVVEAPITNNENPCSVAGAIVCPPADLPAVQGSK